MRPRGQHRHAATDDIIYSHSRNSSSSGSATSATIRAVAPGACGRGRRHPRRGDEAGSDLRVLSRRGDRHERPRARRTSCGRSANSNCPSRRSWASPPTRRASPINVMGMTKAMQERIVVEGNLESTSTRFVCVRYGNVLSSRGSVDPALPGPDRHGGPVTITLPRDDAVPAQPRSMRSTRFSPRWRDARRGEIVVPKVRVGSDRGRRRRRSSAIATSRSSSPASAPARRSTRSWSPRRRRTAPSSASATTSSGPCCPSCDGERRRRSTASSRRRTAIVMGEELAALIAIREFVDVATTAGARPQAKVPADEVLTVVGTRPELIRLCSFPRMEQAGVEPPGPHRTKLRPAPFRHLLRGARLARADIYLGVRPDGRRPDRADRRRQRARDAGLPARRAAVLGDTNSGLSAIRGAARRPDLPYGGRQPLLRLERAGGEEPQADRPHLDWLLPYTPRSREYLLDEGISRPDLLCGNPITESSSSSGRAGRPRRPRAARLEPTATCS